MNAESYNKYCRRITGRDCTEEHATAYRIAEARTKQLYEEVAGHGFFKWDKLKSESINDPS